MIYIIPIIFALIFFIAPPAWMLWDSKTRYGKPAAGLAAFFHLSLMTTFIAYVVIRFTKKPDPIHIENKELAIRLLAGMFIPSMLAYSCISSVTHTEPVVQAVKHESTNKPKPAAKPAKPKPKRKVVAKKPVAPIKTSYTLVSEERVDTGASTRASSRVVIPLGRSEQALRATLEKAGWDLYKKHGVNAVMVFGFRPGDKTDSSYSAGRAIIAPNGDWGSAGLAQDGVEARASIDVSKLYFAKSTARRPSSKGYVLVDGFVKDGMVYISRRYESWGDEDTIAKLPPGLPVKILETRKEVMSDYEMVRYRVAIRHKGRTIVGWIQSDDIKQ